MKPGTIDHMLPPMKCDSGCGECCGVVAVSKGDYDRVMAYARKNGLEPQKNGIRCPWYQNGTCAVYEVRPTVCRIFGHVPDMSCSRGYNVNVSPGVNARVSLMMIDEMKNQAAVLLHDAVYTPDELKIIIVKAVSKTAVLTVNGKKPANDVYHAARTLHLTGRGFEDCVFIDENGG